MEREIMSEEEALAAVTFIVLMVYNRKGGVGKTLIAAALATLLAALGFHVGIADGDDQENVSSLDKRNRARASLSNVIMETRMGSTVHPPVPLRNAMVQIRKRLWLIRADTTLGTASDHIGNQDEQDILADRIEELRRTLAPPPPWKGRFPWMNKSKVGIHAFQLEPTTDEEYLTPPDFLDFFFWDTPPAENHLTTSMMLASDKILVPVEMDQFSADGLKKVIGGIKHKFRHRARKAEIVGVLPNKILHQPGDTVTLDFLESVFRHFPEYARPAIHHDLNLKNAWAYGLTALEYNRDSRGIRELCALALELIGYEGDMAGVSSCDICDAAVARALEAVPAQAKEA
jgi:cellulose biosynthesis protein BcsQ